MGGKTPKKRLKELKKQHRKKKQKADKYEHWLSASVPILELYSEQYELIDKFRKLFE